MKYFQWWTYIGWNLIHGLIEFFSSLRVRTPDSSFHFMSKVADRGDKIFDT